MEKISLIDETFDRFRSESYSLSVEVSMGGYKICVIDTVRDSVISLVTSPFDSPLSDLNDWNDTIKSLFAQHEILTRKFKSVHFSFESMIFTVVPTEIFVPEKAKQLLETVHQLPDLFEVRYSHVKELNATVIFALPASLTSKWLEKQPKTIFVGHAAPLLTISSLTKWAKDEPLIIAQFGVGFCTLTVSKNKELCSCNSIAQFETNDTTYHLINTCKLVGFDPNSSEINLSGACPNFDALESLLGQYFKKVNVANLLDTHSFTYNLSKYKSSYWNLFNLTLCE
jgi:hypothetical protein